MKAFPMKALFLLVLYTFNQYAIGADEKLSDYLWTETNQLHEDALNSFFVQGIKNASLDPTAFGGYMIQDAVYMYLSAKSIATAANRAIDPDLKQFLQQTVKSYESLYIDMFKKWHIEDTSGIKLGDACANYVKHLDDVANNLEPVYMVAAIIPCVRLWPWIGEQIGVDSSDKFGVYTEFAKTNFDPTYKGYELYEFMINNAYKEGTIEKANALQVYQKSMKGEVDFFTFM